ncbi:porphobilinogen synthase [Anaplasmataceae bacterium AB001_6]|nr:porphobilinogen synthase [Anaplasmataceae bacterium AB001_6]
MYPRVRMRRRRSSEWVRSIYCENNISIDDLIQPLFVIEGKDKIETFCDGIERYSIDKLLEKVSEIISLGIKSIMIFPCIDEKLRTYNAAEAINPSNLICRAIREIKSKFGNSIGVISDIALDPYTISGHDGLTKENDVLNDKTIEVLCKQSLIQASAGSDIISPSDMMDGRIMHIRDALDNCNMHNVSIMSYAVKYNSNLYDPFREIIGSKRKEKIDKSSYQMDFRNSDEAIEEIKLDIKEGADFIIVKPSMFYCDIIYRASKEFNIPIISYQVSGEYIMLKDNLNMLMEQLLSLKRAGSRAIITYAAHKIALHIIDRQII